MILKRFIPVNINCNQYEVYAYKTAAFIKISKLLVEMINYIQSICRMTLRGSHETWDLSGK